MSGVAVKPVLAAAITGLTVEVEHSGAVILDGVDLVVRKGEIVGLAGETGSGKTTLGMALLGYVAPGLRISAGEVAVGERVITDLPLDALRRLRGDRIAAVPQDPQAALNPGMTLGESVRQVMRAHGLDDEQQQTDRLLELFQAVRLPEPAKLATRYPHQVSGGQLQRVAIAIAFAFDPEVVVMDEPTTGLDTATKRAVVELVRELCREKSAGVVFISHELRLLLDLADRVLVMQHGVVVEEGVASTFRQSAKHPYSQKLLASLPGEADAVATPGSAVVPAVTPLLQVTDMAARHGSIQVTHGLTFSVARGECLAVVGESGSGKTTTARAIAGLHHQYSGVVELDGTPLERVVSRRMDAQTKAIQYVFQNPYASLNPRRSVGRSIALAAGRYGRPSRQRIQEVTLELIEAVGLRADHLDAMPYQLSGGQRQRVALARALAVEPELLVCDEVTSALDVSVQAEIIDLLQRLRAERGLTMVFITHDLALARTISDHTAVLLRGEIIEQGPTSQVLQAPQHPYTQSLLASVGGNDEH